MCSPTLSPWPVWTACGLTEVMVEISILTARLECLNSGGYTVCKQALHLQLGRDTVMQYIPIKSKLIMNMV